MNRYKLTRLLITTDRTICFDITAIVLAVDFLSLLSWWILQS